MAPIFLRQAALRGFADRITLRDPHGRGRRPNLLASRVSEEAEARSLVVSLGEMGVRARGPFNLQQRYVVTRAQGRRFCEVTGDQNPIHFEGDVVPGALTAARVLLAIEVLFPGLDVRRVTTKFTAVARYGRSQFAQIRCEPGPSEVSFAAQVAEEGTTVAELSIVAVRRIEALALVPRRRVHVAKLQAVQAFAHALGVRPGTFIRRPHTATRRDGGLFYYPRAFLAALPSGAMVRQLRGEGGLLNKLTFEFEPRLRVAVTSDAEPLVDVRPPDLRKSAFHKILTAVRSGIGSVMRGTALVFTGSTEAIEARRVASLREVVPDDGAGAAPAAPAGPVPAPAQR